MTDRLTNVAVLGSTGSIGRSTLEVIAASEGRLRAVGMSANGNTELLLRQAEGVRPRAIAVTDPAAAGRQDWSGLPAGCELLVGPEAVARLAAEDSVDIVVSAIVGMPACGAPGRRWRPARPSPWPTRRAWWSPGRW